ENLADVLIDANQFGDAVARGGWRQIHDAAIEAMAGGKTFTHIVVDRNVADFRLEHLPTASRRCAIHDISAGIFVADRRDLARLAAEDVEHANTVVARRDLGERADADVVLEVCDSLSVHDRLLLVRLKRIVTPPRWRDPYPASPRVVRGRPPSSNR